MATNTWTSDRRLYLDKGGNVVEADSPDRATLLVPAGGALPRDRARALGLVTEAGETARALGGGAEEAGEPSESPTKRTPANKGRRVPAEDK